MYPTVTTLKLGNNICPSAEVTKEELYDLEMGEKEELFFDDQHSYVDDWKSLLEWAETQIPWCKTQDEVFGVFKTLNETQKMLVDLGLPAVYCTIPDNLQPLAQQRLWEIKHPVSAAIAMGEIYKYTVCGTIIVELKKEVNVQA